MVEGKISAKSEITIVPDQGTKYQRFLDLSKLKLKEISIDKIKHFAVITINNDDPLYPLSTIDQVDLSQLEYLSLDDNELSSIPADLFKEMSSLKTISIRKNKITKLPKRIFHHLRELEKLHLDDNMLENISGEDFKDLINLKVLSISSNKLNYLDIDSFFKLSKLRRLFLNYNDLESLPNRIFHSLKNVKAVFLGNNKLLKLNENLFDKMYRLRRLNLVDNEFTFLPSGIFKSQINLQVLSLDIDKIQQLPGSLAVCRNLENLSQKYDANDYSFIQASIKAKNPEFITGEHYDYIDQKEEISKYKEQISIFEDNLYCIECGFENIPGDKDCTKCSKSLFYS